VLAEQQYQANYDQGCDVQYCSNDVDATETVLRLTYMLLMIKHPALAHWDRNMKLDTMGQLVPKAAALQAQPGMALHVGSGCCLVMYLVPHPLFICLLCFPISCFLPIESLLHCISCCVFCCNMTSNPTPKTAVFSSALFQATQPHQLLCFSAVTCQTLQPQHLLCSGIFPVKLLDLNSCCFLCCSLSSYQQLFCLLFPVKLPNLNSCCVVCC
jgi:hypothetical protein